MQDLYAENSKMLFGENLQVYKENGGTYHVNDFED